MTSIQILTRKLYDFREKRYEHKRKELNLQSIKNVYDFKEAKKADEWSVYISLTRTYHLLLLLMDSKDRSLFYQWRLARIHKSMVRAKTPRHGYRKAPAKAKKPLPKTR